ncbi:MAG: type II toxin-antitoxin system RelE/ParE family toxin [Mangrovibacterium sp.]
MFVDAVQLIAEHPAIGRKVDFGENVRLRNIQSYLLFYEYDDEQIKVLSVWDGRRDDQQIKVT